nr:uncharacterized protein LOC106692370 [Halyomorpha halys]
MDLIYLTETIAYNAIRNPIYERYDTSQWQRSNNQERAKMTKEKQSQNHTSAGSCKLCKEKQKRVLGNYIRTKSVECSSKSSIPEEEEESTK